VKPRPAAKPPERFLQVCGSAYLQRRNKVENNMYFKMIEKKAMSFGRLEAK
jgi:hypothetical protein